MTPGQILAFVGFAIVLAATPGPSNTLLTATGARVGVVRGLPALLGVAVGMAVLMFVVAFGVGAIILANPLILMVVKWIGAAVLCWLAWQIATSRHTSTDETARPLGFPGMIAFQWVNPKSWLAVTSGAATFLNAGQSGPLVQALMLAIIFGLVSLPCCFVWLAFGAVVQRALRSERAIRIFNIAMGLVLALSVVLFVL